MLLGEGPHWTNDASPPRKALASKAWRPWPTPGRKSEELAPIRQGPDEPHQDFVSRLLQAVSRSVPDGEAGMLPVTRPAQEKADSARQSAVRPWKKKGSLSDYGRSLCRYRTIVDTGVDISRSAARNDYSRSHGTATEKSGKRKR